MNPASALSAAPDVAIGVAFLLAWLFPRLVGVDMVNYALLTMLLEFIVVHSAGFMGVVILDRGSHTVRKTGLIVGLGVIYSIFVGAFCVAFDTWWPMVAFWSLTLNRLTGVFFHTAPEGEERRRQESGWATGAVLYLIWIFITVILPLPRLGLTEAVVADAHLPGSGLWVEKPQKVIAAGAGYFLSQAYVELHEAGWFKSGVTAGQRS
jgi:hypothetical protein